MKRIQRPLRWLAGAMMLPTLLTACQPIGPVPDMGTTFRFRLPQGAETERLRIAAMYTTKDAEGQIIQKVVPDTYGYVQGAMAELSLRKSDLTKVLQDGCLPYLAGKVKPNLTPASATLCDINFVVYDSLAGVNGPTTANLRYLTHDTYSYASEKLTYTSTVTGQDGDTAVTSQETGERRAGWSLVPHLVINPSAIPNLYRVVRNSVDDSRLKLELVMHAPSDYFTSMGTTTGAAQ